MCIDLHNAHKLEMIRLDYHIIVGSEMTTRGHFTAA